MKENDKLQKLNEKLVEELVKNDAEIIKLKDKIQHHETLIDRLSSFIPEKGMCRDAFRFMYN